MFSFLFNLFCVSESTITPSGIFPSTFICCLYLDLLVIVALNFILSPVFTMLFLSDAVKFSDVYSNFKAGFTIISFLDTEYFSILSASTVVVAVTVLSDSFSFKAFATKLLPINNVLPDPNSVIEYSILFPFCFLDGLISSSPKYI